MARLLHAPVLHDENATSSISMLKAGANAGGGGLGKMALLSTKTEGRRALGNITNRAPAGGAQPSESKGKPSEPAPRRALGDITNSVAPKQGPAKQGSQAKPGAVALVQPKALFANVVPQQAAAPQQQSAVTEAEAAAAEAAAALQAKAELYALDGIERIAGKGWVEQEAERACRQEAQLQWRLGGGGGMVVGAPHWTGFAFRHAVNDACSSDDDALGFLSETPPASPKAVRPRYVPEYLTPLSDGSRSHASGASPASIARLAPGGSSPGLDFFAMLPELSFGASPAQ